MAGPNKPRWNVDSRDDWDILYQQSVIYFWNLCDRENENSRKIEKLKAQLIELELVMIGEPLGGSLQEAIEDILQQQQIIQRIVDLPKNLSEKIQKREFKSVSINIFKDFLLAEINQQLIGEFEDVEPYLFEFVISLILEDMVTDIKKMMPTTSEQIAMITYKEKLEFQLIRLKNQQSHKVDSKDIHSEITAIELLKRHVSGVLYNVRQIKKKFELLDSKENQSTSIEHQLEIIKPMCELLADVELPKDLFFIYGYMGVENIQPTDQDGVVFYVTTSGMADVKPESYDILKVLPNYGDVHGKRCAHKKAKANKEQNKNNPQNPEPSKYQGFDVDGQYNAGVNSHINGWLGLSAELTIKIPNATLLPQHVACFVEKFGLSEEQHMCLNNNIGVVASLMRQFLDSSEGDKADNNYFSDTQLQSINDEIGPILANIYNLMCLNNCCLRLLGNSLPYYFSYLFTPENKNKLIEDGCVVYFLEVFGDYMLELMIIAKALAGASRECNIKFDHFTEMRMVSIPEYLVLIGIFEQINEQYHLYVKRQRSHDKETNHYNDIQQLNYEQNCKKYERYKNKLASLEQQIYIPLTSLLSSYVSLGLYFPFGLEMTPKTIERSQRSLVGLREVIQSAYPIVQSLKSYSLDGMVRDIYGGLTGSPCSDKTFVIVDFVIHLCKEFAIGQQVSESKQNKQYILNTGGVLGGGGGGSSSVMANGNRGGAGSINEDISWDYFMPILIAYNWEILNRVDSKYREEILKNNTYLRDCKAMLYSLGYVLPNEVQVKFELKDDLPFIVTESHQKISNSYEFETENSDEISLIFDWNYEKFISVLTVDYPDPPSAKIRAFAMCDLNARRPNQPFTTA